MHDSQARRPSDAGNCRIDEGNMPKRKLARAARIESSRVTLDGSRVSGSHSVAGGVGGGGC